MGKKYTILCVDDEISILKALQRLFHNTKYKITTAQSGLEAISLLKKEKFEVIISDFKMPQMNGIEFFKKAKKIATSAVRIMLTAYSDIDITIAAINEGEIHKYITKPWNNVELKEIIAEAIRKNEKRLKKEEYIPGEREIKREIKNIKEVLHRASFETVKALSSAIELKDHYTRGHCDRVMNYAVLLAEMIELDEKCMMDLRFASQVHDIGKIGIPAHILNKPGPLNKEERKLIEEHPHAGAVIIAEVDFLTRAAQIVLEHHEHVDGKGYPYGKMGDDLLLESKILAIADVYDALTSERSYRKAFDKEKALEILAAEKNKMFDAALVDIFIEQIVNKKV
jgi:putative two-component system response regulator